jgi:hypothetical protein
LDLLRSNKHTKMARSYTTSLTSLPPFRLLLYVLPILMIDSIIELSFVSAMVGFLHGRANGFFIVDYPGTDSPSGPDTFELWAKPKVLLENQGHTSNGAAGTAFVLIGFGGLLLIWWEKRRLRNTASTKPSGLFTTYVVLTFLSTLLCLAALIYTFVLTHNHTGQTIDLAVASQTPAPRPYPLDEWTPENWFGAVLDQVPLRTDSDTSKLRNELRIMQGWRWNLVPLFMINVLVASVAAWEWWRLRRGAVGRGQAVAKEGTPSL